MIKNWITKKKHDKIQRNLEIKIIHYHNSKPMRLEVTNQIIEDLDSKQANFDRRFWSNSKSNDEFESTIMITI